MPRSDWRDGKFALGLVVGACLTLIIFCCAYFLYPPLRQSSQNVSYTERQADAEQNYGQDDRDSTWWRRDGYLVSSGDTAAQWIMTISTIVAAGLLYLTLRSTNETSKSAVNASTAALKANEIMRAEQRPILAPNGEIAQPFGDTIGGQIPAGFDFAFVFKNVGKFPAKVIDAVVEVQRIEIAGGKDHLTGTIRLDDPRSLHRIYLSGEEFVTREKLIHVEDFTTHDHFAVVKVTYRAAIGNDEQISYITERRGHLRLVKGDSVRIAGAFNSRDITGIAFIPEKDGLQMD